MVAEVMTGWSWKDFYPGARIITLVLDADEAADGDTIGSSEQGSHSCAHARAHQGAHAHADSCADQGTDEAAHGFPVE